MKRLPCFLFSLCSVHTFLKENVKYKINYDGGKAMDNVCVTAGHVFSYDSSFLSSVFIYFSHYYTFATYRNNYCKTH